MSFEQELAKIVKTLESRINKFVDAMAIQDGRFLVKQENFKNATILYNEVMGALRDSGFEDVIGKEMLKSKSIIDERIDAVSTFKEVGKFDKTMLKDLMKTQFGEVMGLGNDAARSVKSVLMQQVISGAQRTEAVNLLKKTLETKLQRHAETLVRTSKNQFTQQVENELAKEVGYGEKDIWEYAGAPLQDNSHAECIWALTQKEHAPYFTNAEKEEFEAGGLFDHTEPRWNCQHNFFMVDLTYEEYLKA